MAGLKRFTETLRDIRDGEVVADLTEQLKQVVARVHETGRPGALILTLKVKCASKGAGSALVIEDDIKTKLPSYEKGTTLLFVNGDGDLQRNDPRQPRLVETTPGGQLVPIGGEKAANGQA